MNINYKECLISLLFSLCYNTPAQFLSEAYSMKIVFIDTTSNQKIIVALTIDGEKFEIKRALEKQKAQIVLPLINELLQKHKVRLYDLDAIEVNPGPGSFTGVRVGVSVANTLSYALGIPVNGMNVAKEDTGVAPTYA